MPVFYCIIYEIKEAKMAKDNLIRVRVKGTAPRNGEIKKFKPMKELPVPGTQIGNGDCYGGASKLTMSIYQNARDEDKLPLYDYYEVDILDSRLLKRDVDYICIPHRAASIIPISMYNELIKTAQKYDDVDLFISDTLRSELWDKYDVDRTGRDIWLRQLFGAVHKTIPEIIKECKLSQGKLAKTFGIPKRTVENWCCIAPPPIYVSLMMQECLGIFTRK